MCKQGHIKFEYKTFVRWGCVCVGGGGGGQTVAVSSGRVKIGEVEVWSPRLCRAGSGPRRLLFS
jgi:hypothetical protein